MVRKLSALVEYRGVVWEICLGDWESCLGVLSGSAVWESCRRTVGLKSINAL